MMKRIRTLLLYLSILCTGTLQTLACDLSSLCLDSVTTIPGGGFNIYTTLCIGAGITGANLGADGNTGNILFSFSSATPGFTVNTYTTPITTQVTNITVIGGNLGPQPTFNAAQAVLYYTGGNDFACINSTPTCGNVHPECYSFVFSVNTLPDSIRAYGVEGNGSLNNGCSGMDMRIQFVPTVQNCCILSSNQSSVAATGCTTPTGSASINITSGVGPYSYFWSNGASTSSVTGLAPGNYNVTVFDALGCRTIKTIAVAGSGAVPTVGVQINPENCNQTNGAITLTATGGAGPPYTYAWSNLASGPTISGLSAGTYTCTITDAGGCSLVSSFPILNTPNPTTTLTGSTVSNCGMNNGTISVSASGGAGSPFTYLWSNGATTSTITGLAPGSYTVTVTDNAGCTNINTYTVGGYNGPAATLAVINENCAGGNNGSVTVNSPTGIGPFTYLWSNGATNQTLNNLPGGAYTVTVTDSVGCTFSITGTVVAGVSPSVIAGSNNEYCGLANGSTTAIGSGGTAPLTYLWSNGQTGFNATGLVAGTYTVTITDAAGCTTTASATVGTTPPPTLNMTTVPATGAANADGSATASLSGGIAPFTYVWSNGGSSATINGLLPGNYTVTVTDSAGCEVTDNITVSFMVGLDALSGSGYTILPNPIQNQLIIRRNENQAGQAAEIRIYDSQGRLLLNEELESGKPEFQWNAEGIAKGIYFVRIISANQDLNVRIIKQ